MKNIYINNKIVLIKLNSRKIIKKKKLHYIVLIYILV